MAKKTAIAMFCVAILLVSLFAGCSRKKMEETTELIEATVAETTEPEIAGVAKNVLNKSDFSDFEVAETIVNTIEVAENRDELTITNEKKPVSTEMAEKIKENETGETNSERQEAGPTEETKSQEENDTVEEVPQSTVETDYIRYHALSGAEQKQFMDNFDSIEAFFEWYNNAKAENDTLLKEIDPENPEIDLSAFAN